MAHVVADRVRETWTGTGTGSITPGGAVSGFRAVSAVMSNGDTAPFVVEHQSAAEWETAIYTWNGTSLARTTIIASSNSGSAVNFSAGTKHIAISPLASRLLNIAPDGSAVLSGSSSTDMLRITQTGSGNALVVEDSANPDASPFVIDGAGLATLGATSSPAVEVAGYGMTPRLGALFTSVTTVGAYTYSNTTQPAILSLNKSRGASVGTMTAVNSGDNLGAIGFGGADGNATPVFRGAASIVGIADGAAWDGGIPGALRFLTRGTSGNELDRMRINSTGQVSIGTTSPNAAAKLQIDSTTQGFLPPRMTTTQRNAITSPPAGLTIFNTSTTKLEVYDGANWQACW